MELKGKISVVKIKKTKAYIVAIEPINNYKLNSNFPIVTPKLRILEYICFNDKIILFSVKSDNSKLKSFICYIISQKLLYSNVAL